MTCAQNRTSDSRHAKSMRSCYAFGGLFPYHITQLQYLIFTLPSRKTYPQLARVHASITSKLTMPLRRLKLIRRQPAVIRRLRQPIQHLHPRCISPHSCALLPAPHIHISVLIRYVFLLTLCLCQVGAVAADESGVAGTLHGSDLGTRLVLAPRFMREGESILPDAGARSRTTPVSL
jgi:hypothetical protein